MDIAIFFLAWPTVNVHCLRARRTGFGGAPKRCLLSAAAEPNYKFSTIGFANKKGASFGCALLLLLLLPPFNGIPKYKRQIQFQDRKSTRLNSSHVAISYAVFCL